MYVVSTFLNGRYPVCLEYLKGPQLIRENIAVCLMKPRNGKTMRKHYDFSKAKKNPYRNRLKKSVTIRLDEPTVEYFRQLAAEAELPYQTLINLYLRDCAVSNRRPSLVWKGSRKGAA